MRYGLTVAPWGVYADPRTLMQLARRAETAGWDGLFLWDAMLHDPDDLPKADPGIALAAIATSIERLRLGTIVTPLARRRPWKLARELVTLDHLSGGRLVLGVGLGDPSDEEFAWFDEVGRDHRTRARMLDEGLAVLTGLWRGEPFRFDGEFYHLREMTFRPVPVQSPRIPIWVGGWWSNRAPMRRAARWDGVVPGRLGAPLTPDDLRALVAYIREHREDAAPFDVVVSGTTSGAYPAAAASHVRRFAEAGATWWLEAAGVAGRAFPPEQIEERIRQGPPRIEHLGDHDAQPASTMGQGRREPGC